MSIPKRIFEALGKGNLQQKELANHLNIPLSTVNNWKQRETSPSAELLIPICVFLNCSIEWLLTGDEPKRTEYKQMPQISPFEKLPMDEKILLNNYRKMDDNIKEKLQDVAVQLITEQPNSKLSTSEDEMSATFEAAN